VLHSPQTNWKGYKYLVFYIRGIANEKDEYNSMDVLLYNIHNGTNDEVWNYSDKSIIDTKYYKQVKIRLGPTNGGQGDFMDVDWDEDSYGNQFILSNINQISFLASGGATAVGEGYFWIDNIFITSNETFDNATMISPEHTTGLAKNTTVKIKIGYNMTNIVCQLVDASNNYYKYEITDSIVTYSDDILTIDFTNLKTGRNIIAVDAVNKNTGVPLNQFVKDLYVGDYYVIKNFENSSIYALDDDISSPFEGTSD
jgi:hypothetical protein